MEEYRRYLWYRSGHGWQWRPQLLARFTSTVHINTPLLHMTESGIKSSLSLFLCTSSYFLREGRKPRNNAQTSTDEILWKNISYASMEHLERADAFLFGTLYFRLCALWLSDSETIGISNGIMFPLPFIKFINILLGVLSVIIIEDYESWDEMLCT